MMAKHSRKGGSVGARPARAIVIARLKMRVILMIGAQAECNKADAGEGVQRSCQKIGGRRETRGGAWVRSVRRELRVR